MPFNGGIKNAFNPKGIKKVITAAIGYDQLASWLHFPVHLGEDIFIGVIALLALPEADTGFFIQVVDRIMKQDDVIFFIVNLLHIILQGKGQVLDGQVGIKSLFDFIEFVDHAIAGAGAFRL